MTNDQIADEFARIVRHAAERETPALDVAAALVKNGVELSLRTAGPVETIDGLLLLLRQLCAEFPDALRIVRAMNSDAYPPAGTA